MSTPFRHDSDHLSVFMNIYAVFYGVGMLRILDAFVERGPKFDPAGGFWLLFAAAVCLGFIALRLIFSPEALSQYLLFMRNEKVPANKHAIVAFHYPVLLVQGAFLYVAEFTLKSYGVCPRVIGYAAVALLTNVVWTGWQLVHARRKGKSRDDHFRNTKIWFTNNLVCGVLALLLIWWYPSLSGYPIGLWSAIAVLVVNSAYDLYQTANWFAPQALPGAQEGSSRH